MTDQQNFDAIVIGAGHNGLTAAAILANKGHRVCVVERSDSPGGMAKNQELAPGLMAPELAHLLYNLNDKVARDLGLGHSIPLQTRDLPSVSLAADGRHVVIRGGAATFDDGSAHPQAVAFAGLHARLVKFAAILGRMSTQSPPKLSGGLADLATLSELGMLARLGLDLKLAGKTEMREFLRILLSNIYDVLLDEMPDGPLAGALAADAVRGAYAGPRSPGTVFSLMYRYGNGGVPKLALGGMGAVTQAFEQAARKAGCEIRCGSGVASVLVEGDRVTGVALEDGSKLSAKAVLSSAGPMQTLQMTGPAHFDVETTRRLRNLRCKGTVAKVNLVLSGTPEFTGLSKELTAGRLLIAPSAEYVELAFNPAKYGEMPTDPVIEMVLPGLTDPNPAAKGQQVLSAVVSYVPPAPKSGWTKAARAGLTKTVLATLERYAPGIGALVTHSETLTPADIQERTGAPGGHWHHAEMGLDQILNIRPVNGMGRYAMGVNGLYLCGASAHPGGDVTGAPGRNAALQLLKDGGV
jgi:phytoene dehydrogenase-like protein